jgi:hypothetical protein
LNKQKRFTTTQRTFNLVEYDLPHQSVLSQRVQKLGQSVRVIIMLTTQFEHFGDAGVGRHFTGLLIIGTDRAVVGTCK